MNESTGFDGMTRHWRRPALALGMAIVLSGCNFTPKYTRPEAPVAGRVAERSGLCAGPAGDHRVRKLRT